MNAKEKVAALRQLMEQHNIDAWIVPSSDPHQSEYVADCWRNRAWISGFSGSAGTVVITREKAGLWTDSRYFLQAARELQGSGIELFKMAMPGVPTYTEWLAQELADQATVGFDGNVLSVNEVEELTSALASKSITLSYQEDLIAPIWKDRPAIPSTPVMLLDVKFAGESRTSKFARIREKIQEAGAQAHLISTLDEIVWMFNIRGNDVECTPVTVGYAYISQDEVRLFIDEKKVPDDVKAALRADGVIFSAYDEVVPYLQHLPKDTSVLLDPQKTSQILKDAVAQACRVKEGQNVVLKMKAIKNDVELAGIRSAHIQDGVAMVKWLYWLDEHVGKEEYTEYNIVDTLAELRRQGEYSQDLSFEPIVGYMPNAALCHYHAEPNTALTVKPEGILLIDSGGQYLTGTTDITRTIALSEPTPQQKQDFTLVLKGHIALATAKFPQGTMGSQLDTFARMALWQYGLNYGHGTGHGVGHFLSVHEGPQSIRPGNNVPLEVGMLCSDEPGLYRTDEYGIRTENLIIVVPSEETEFGAFYQFETVTLCPIDLDFIDVTLLSPDEKAWLNTYHQKVYKQLSEFLNDEEKAWLKHETREI